ncbi:MAG: response regulator transcription factor [Sphingobacteriia bacterium]|jgi:DNA-binding NarL/FixJ family response regulator
MLLIGVIEDNDDLRESITRYIFNENELVLVFSVTCIEDWLNFKKKSVVVPDIILLDIKLPGISGVDGILLIKQFYKSSKIIIISGLNDPKIIWDSMLNGANGFLVKPFRMLEVKEKIQIITEGGTYLDPTLLSKVIEREQRNVYETEVNRLIKMGFTKRELQLAELLIKGYSYKDIAAILSISYTTVNSHIKHIYSKTNVNSKSAFIAQLLNEQKTVF